MKDSIRSPRRWLAGAAVLGLVVPWLVGSPESAVTDADATRVQARTPTRFQGAGSCSAVACHGSIVPQPGSRVLRNEHTTWISDDPHARAYQVLSSRRSEEIVTRLAGGKPPALAAHADPRCLACHATPRPASMLKETAWLNADGVGCESCHGASERWLGPHTTAGWQDLAPSVKERDYGLIDTKDLARRAAACTTCHVGRLDGGGTALGDVNHDLIAAGHPRLNFEFAGYHDQMPAHWVEKGRNAEPDFPARAWSVGQVVSARAALQLLHDRAASRSAPWPEFSEYDCFSCHHNLADEAWRRKPRAGSASTGAPPWGSWYFPMARELLKDRPATTSKRPAGELEASLRTLLGTLSRPLPDRPEVARRAQDCLPALDRALADLTTVVFDGPGVERLIRRFNDPDAWQTVASWDHAAQRYLALVPLRQAWVRLDRDHSQDQRQLAAELHGRLRQLEFGTDLNSPRGFVPTQVVPRRGENP